MKTVLKSILIVALLGASVNLKAQYLGGNGRGDYNTFQSLFLNGVSAIPVKIAFFIQPIDVNVNDTFSIQIEVQFSDGTRASRATDTISISLNTNGQTPLYGLLSTPAVNGVATFTGISVGEYGFNLRMIASAASLVSDTSDEFNVNPNIYIGGTGSGDDENDVQSRYMGNTWIGGHDNTFTSGNNWSSGHFPFNETAYIPYSAANPEAPAYSTTTIPNGTRITLMHGMRLTIPPTSNLVVHGSLNISNGFLLLQSDHSGTAAVGNSTGVISGNTATVQRFIPAVARRWRMLSTNIGSFQFSQLIDDIFVTGAGGSTNGFDSTPTNDFSIYTYQEDTNGGRGWKPITTITQGVNPGVGFLSFIRGNRSLQAPQWYTYPYVSQNPVTIDYTGPLFQGSLSIPLSYTNAGLPADNGWNLVGNPYASQIDWNSLQKRNIGSFYYILNPATNSYEAFSNGNIASGQSFFVQAIDTGALITFEENCKTSTVSNGLFKAADPSVTVKIIKDSLTSDLATIRFQTGASRYFNVLQDARKFPNSSINICFILPGLEKVQINSVAPLSSPSDTFPISVVAPQGSYTFALSSIIALPSNKLIFVRDLYTGALINCSSNPSFTFVINNVTSSMGERFQLIFANSSVLAAGEVILEVNRIKSTPNLEIDCVLKTERKMNSFTIERSFTLEDYDELKSYENIYPSMIKQHTISFIDYQTITEAMRLNITRVYYRLKLLDDNGSISYSEVVPFDLREVLSSELFVIYPNPAGDILFIHPAYTEDEVKSIIIFDLNGKPVLNRSFESTTPIDIRSLSPGLYGVEINHLNRQYLFKR